MSNQINEGLCEEEEEEEEEEKEEIEPRGEVGWASNDVEEYAATDDMIADEGIKNVGMFGGRRHTVRGPDTSPGALALGIKEGHHHGGVATSVHREGEASPELGTTPNAGTSEGHARTQQQRRKVEEYMPDGSKTTTFTISASGESRETGITPNVTTSDEGHAITHQRRTLVKHAPDGSKTTKANSITEVEESREIGMTPNIATKKAMLEPSSKGERQLSMSMHPMGAKQQLTSSRNRKRAEALACTQMSLPVKAMLELSSEGER